jgi:hypothetical protein
MGRPSKYKEEYCDQIIEFMSNGASLCEFAAEISVNQDTVFEWAKVHPLFSEAVHIAQTKSQAAMEKIGRGAMMGKIKIKENIWTFSMGRRFKHWRQSTAVEHTGTSEVTITNLTDDSIDRRIQELMALKHDQE